MFDFRRLALQSNEELARYDIIDVHLACAARLPGAEKIDGVRCHKIIDELVEWSKPYTAHVLAKGRKLEPDDTEARIRIRAMIQVVWKGKGIRYNPAKVPDDCEWLTEDSFVHGALYGEGEHAVQLQFHLPDQYLEAKRVWTTPPPGGKP